MNHVARGAAPSADRFIDMFYSSSITNHKAASEHWTACNVEKPSGASESYAGCAVGCSVESDGATLLKMSTVICKNIHRGGSFFHSWVILVFHFARLIIKWGLWCHVFVSPSDLCGRVRQKWHEKYPKYLGLKRLRLEGVSFTQSELSLTFSCAWKAWGTGLSMCVTWKWVSWRLCNSGITVCGTKHAVTDLHVCVLDTFSLH